MRIGRRPDDPAVARLLRLPAFLRGEAHSVPSLEELRQGFALTGFFLAHHLFEPRGMPTPERRAFLVAEIARL